MIPTDLFGKFDIGGGTIYAYGPATDKENREWLIIFKRDDHIVHQEVVEMLYAPVFGYDAGDIAALNSRVEELIRELDLE